ncbi:MAG: hypothetical protein AB1813_08640 [Verrucomicrobiota bacterium]
MRSSLCFALITLWIIVNSPNYADPPGSLDYSFDPGLPTTSGLRSIAIQSDGRIIIAGIFDKVGGIARTNIARLHADGSVDLSFNAGRPIDILSVAVQTDGKTLAAGRFTSFNRLNRRGLVRLNPNGEMDTGFNSGTGPSGTVRCVTVQPDGRILIGGEFLTFNGVSRRGIARLNSDGSLDLSFDPEGGARGWVYCVAAREDGKLLLGGDFTTFAGVSANRIVQLDSSGKVDATFNVGAGADSVVHSITIQQNGQILVMGEFTRFNNAIRNRIARLDPNGNLDLPFNSGSGPSGPVFFAIPQKDGYIVIGGGFTRISGKRSPRLARLEPNGTLDPTFDVGLGALGVSAGVLQGETKCLIVGGFSHYAGDIQTAIARIHLSNAPPTIPRILSQPSHATVKEASPTNFAVTVRGSKPIAYQWFRQDGVVAATPRMQGANDRELTLGSPVVSDTGAYSVLVSNPAGSVRSEQAVLSVWLDPARPGSIDSSFYLGPVDAAVRTLIKLPNGQLIIGGDFKNINGTPKAGLARAHANGTLDDAFVPKIGGNVEALALQGNGGLLVGGRLAEEGSAPKSCIFRLTADGAIDSSFSAVMREGAVIAQILAQPDGRILVAGLIPLQDTAPFHCLVRLESNGALDLSFSTPARTTSLESCIELQPDGKILLGGRLMIPNLNNPGLVRLLQDGRLDPTFPVQNWQQRFVTNLELDSQERIVVIGDFEKHIARLLPDGSDDPTFLPANISRHPTGFFQGLAIQPDGRILVNASATQDRISREGFVRLNSDGSIDALFDVKWSIWQPKPIIILDDENRILIAGGLTSVERLHGGDTTAAALPPNLYYESPDREAVQRSTVTLAIAASGAAPLRYQWKKDGAPLLRGTNTVLVLTNVTRASAANYSVEVFNSVGTIETRMINLRVLVPQHFEPIEFLKGGPIRIRFRDEGGTTPTENDLKLIELHTSSDLNEWTPLAPLRLNNGFVEFEHQADSESRLRFYRAVHR